MAIDIPGEDDIFEQRDVRETPAATATATINAVTDATYLTLSLHADLTDERVLTAGEGIDFSDTGANGTLTILGEDATSANKGIASFDATDFSVTAGAVTITNSGIDHDATTNFVANEHIDWTGASAGTIHITNVADATTTTKGVSSFLTDDFAVSGGAVSLKNKTSYWSTVGQAFRPMESGILFTTPGAFEMQYLSGGASGQFSVGVNLPNGAIVTGVIVYGSDVTNNWRMFRITNDGGAASQMAGAVVQTEDTTISNATIDNSLYSYEIDIVLGANDFVDAARITYTTDYD